MGNPARMWWLLVLMAGCSSLPGPTELTSPPPGVNTVIFCADGAGDFRVSSSKLRRVVEEDHVPLHVITFPWSHGHYRILADQVDYHHARRQGQRLAQEMAAYHAQHPQTVIQLWGHSAGAMVALIALEELPPGVVQRAVLLSPSVAADYDIRRALANVQGTMHVYFSRRDLGYLGVGTTVFGTSDRRWAAASGRVGFRHISQHPADLALYGKLIQQPWCPEDNDLGHHGGHYGAYQPNYIRRYILPVLLLP